MKRLSMTAIAFTAGGTLAVGGIAVAAPVLAGPARSGGPPAASQTADPGRPGAGYGMGQRFQRGPGDGTCLNLTAPNGTLTVDQKTLLAKQAEEEKLAHDLYAAFAARYDVRIFDQIANAEVNHLSAIRMLLDRYGVTDPTEGKNAGQFASADVKTAYDRQLVQGTVSQRAALQVGVMVEKAQIAALRKAAQGVKAADVKHVYDRLIATSQLHLAAFGAWAN